MIVTRPSGLTRADLFQTNHRLETTGLSVLFTDTPSDPRIGVRILDNRDASQAFLSITYHYVVRSDGRVEIGRNPKTVSTRGRVTAHHCNLYVGVVGGRTKDGLPDYTVTDAQHEATERLMQEISNVLNTPLEVTGNVRPIVDAPDDQDEIADRQQDELEAHLDATEI